MTSRAAALALANILMLLFGCGLLPLLRLARTRREIVARLPLAYAVGLAAAGILAAELAVGGIAVGPLVLTLVTIAALALGLPGLPAGERWRPRRPRASELAPLLVLAAAVSYAVPSVRLAVVKPLLEPAGWEIWATRAKALYLFGQPHGPAFTDPLYHGLQQPLLLPALEAVAFRFMGAFDGTLLHLQLLGFAVAFVGGAWTLLRRWTNPLLLTASLLAIVAAPAFLDELLSNSADVPLATFVALGVAALAAWLRSGEVGFLAAATLFLGAGALTKAEGEWFALCAFALAALVARPEARRSVAIAGATVLALVLPWQLWLWLGDVQPTGPAGLNLFGALHLGSDTDRAGPAASALWHQLWRVHSWSFLVPLVLLGLAGALVQRRFRLAAFGAGWLVLSFAGLIWVYRVSTSAPATDLTGSPDLAVASIVLAGGLLVPLLLHTGPVPEPVPVPERTRDPLRGAFAFVRGAAEAIPLPRRTVDEATQPRALPWARPRREALLLALVAVVALSPVYPINAQDVSRLCLTRALVHLHLSNDRCLDTPYARDKASYGGHLYSDKAPGMSLLELPAAVAVRLPSAESWPLEGPQLWAVRLLAAGIGFLACVFLVGRISEGLAPGYGGMSLVTFGLGTLAAPFAAANFGHVTAGTLGLAAFALAWTRRPLLSGLAAGAAVVVEYEALVILVVLAAYVAVQSRRSLGRYVTGLIPGGLVLGVYDWLAFGAPWHLSYRYKGDEFASEQSSGFFGIHMPYRHAIHDVFVGSGGLLRISPVLVACGFGLVLLGRRYRAEAIVCAAVMLAFVVVNCGYFNPYGGLSPGPRFLVPALPFLALGLGPAFASRFKLTTVLAVLSILPITALTVTWPNGPPEGTIWRGLERFPVELGSSQLVDNLTANALHWVWLGRPTAAALVALAAASALVLSLPLSFRTEPAPSRTPARPLAGPPAGV